MMTNCAIRAQHASKIPAGIFSPVNRLWHFMQIDNLLEMSVPVYGKN